MKIRITFLTLLALALTACAPTQAVDMKVTATATLPQKAFSTATFTPASSDNTQIPSVTQTSPPPSPTPLPRFSLDGLRMAYIVNGNVYVQDDDSLPLQLTHNGEDWQPLFSQNGEKILFFRGKTPHELLFIDPDSGQEQELISNELLISLGVGYDQSTGIVNYSLVPGTQYLLFSTGEVNRQGLAENRPPISNLDLLRIDLETRKIKVLLSPGNSGSFLISPDGSMIAVNSNGHIDLIDVDGRMLRRNFVTYTPTHPYKLNPEIFWNLASTNLIVVLPVSEIYDMGGPVPYSIWKYDVNDNSKTQVSFDPPPTDSCCASPDGNWFLYSYTHYPDETDPSVYGGFYLGNLKDNTTQLYLQYGPSFEWSPDSVHFIFGNSGEIFLGDVNAPPEFISDNVGFFSWLDSDQFLYYSRDDKSFHLGKIESSDKGQKITSTPIGSILEGTKHLTFTYTGNIGK